MARTLQELVCSLRPHKWHCRPNYEALHIMDGTGPRPFEMKKKATSRQPFLFVYFNFEIGYSFLLFLIANLLHTSGLMN